ncbi:hypothetical protein Forpe1208_v015574 [Fusarium oxysporum f. sp. rapae]|uniref:Uncharacterized protein n=1 Tax=Fusarium oxysporum f. sp. rapae TaxID=485398 RepID=A0A8J5NHX0_FUSOX|nr:hypothetical protein Forpe1208_v015574 [Fusarium oxysporum f. sp. rapae]
MIHLSSDLWTSPYRHGMLAVCGQWVGKGYKLRKALLGLLECRKDHSGVSQAGLIADVLERFEIRRLGYHTGDNASSSNACLEALSKKLLHGRGIIFDPVRRRVRCFDHIINLSLQTFLLARSKEALHAAVNDAGIDAGAQSIETFSTALKQNTPSGPDTTVDHTSEEKQGRQQRPPTRERTTQLLEFSGWEGINALQKLHHFAVWIGSSPIHSDNWHEVVGRSLGIDNATRWSSWYKVISVAVDKEAQIVQFMVDHDKDIGCAHLLGADWDILSKTHIFSSTTLPRQL